MSGCLCIHWLGAALSFQRIMLRRVQTAALGLCRGVYVFIGWVAALSFQRFMLRRVQTAAVGLCRGVYVLIARVGALSFLRIMHRRVQTAAVGLCRGVYVFIGRVAAGSMIGNMSYNSRGDALTTVYGFLRGLLMYLQPEYNCISRETVSYTSRGTIPHIVTNYPRAYIQRRTEHFRGCLQTPVLNPPKADFSIRCACNQTRVCRRKCSDRRHPNESVPTEVF